MEIEFELQCVNTGSSRFVKFPKGEYTTKDDGYTVVKVIEGENEADCIDLANDYAMAQERYVLDGFDKMMVITDYTIISDEALDGACS